MAGERDNVLFRGGGLRPLLSSAAALLVGAASLVVTAASPAAADGPTTFTNASSIAIPAAGSANQIGPASPYPSSITVVGMAGPVTNVTVTLDTLTHSVLNDVDVMLVAPTGVNLIVLSDPGDVAVPTATSAANATYTFSDAAAGFFPQSGNIASGTYRPTNTGAGDPFPAPAPAASTQLTLAGAFTGINPNGTWQLFVVDDTTGDVGTMTGGWSLTITTAVAAAATTTTVASSGTPSTTGNPVTFTATVTSAGNPVTTGAVQFADGATNLGTPVPLNAGGVATLTTSALGEGTHTIFATYTGAAGFLTSTGTVTQRVDNATVVTGNTFCNTGPLTIPPGGAAQPYPSNITVSGLSGTITDVTVTLKGLSHSFPPDVDVLLAAPGGTNNLVLMSDVGGNSAVSGLEVVFDDAAPGPVPSPITSGTFRATDNDADGSDTFPSPAPVPTTATTLATFDGSAPNGTWSLYVNDDASGDSGSIAGGWCLTVRTPAATATALTSNLNPSTVGQAVTFTATVTAAGAPVTAGTVSFTDGGAPLGGPVTLAADGTATLTTSALTAGTHPIAATYSGTATFLASTATLDQVINQATTATALTSNLNPSTVGQAVTFTATVTAAGAPVTAGTVSFTDGGAPLGGPVTLAADGTATLTTSALTAGTHPIAATYSGTATFLASTATLDKVVIPVADAGGPYTLAEGAALTLDGSGSTAGATHAWDLDGDGDFTDATGVAPTLSWDDLQAFGIEDGPAAQVIAVRVTVDGQTATATADLEVTNTAPVSVITGALTATVGVPFTLKIGSDDPSSADMAGTFRYTVDWGDGSPIESVDGPADPPVTHTYGAAGAYSATFTATDQDGGASDPAVVQVQVSPATTTTTYPPTTTSTRTTTTPVDTDGALSSTGADTRPLLIGAAVLTATGLALLVVAGRRRQITR